ncbi:MAG TPA: hypothetical protein VLZ31_08425, partial [Microbacteriaceae bacterium]|nr:hypothetical protein [Microbacteriaceae bacterium]
MSSHIVASHISEFAYIGESVQIGENVSIGPYAVLLGPTIIEDGVWIGSGA